MTAYNTHLALEFYVLSVLHRLGMDANLTLGNKKAVDIVIVRGVAETVTVDVKGLAGTTGWPADNLNVVRDEHFVVLICYLGRISDPSVMPESYVVPSTRLRRLTYHAPGGRKLIRLSTMREEGREFHNAWDSLK